MATDISKLKQAEAEIRRSEAIMKSVLDQSPVAFNLKDMDRRYLIVNKAHAEWFGRSAEAMIDAPAMTFTPAEQVGMFEKAEREILKTKRAVDPLEYRDEKPFRDPMDLLVYKFPVTGADDELIGIGTIQSDITERKRAEQIIADAMALINESIQYASRIQRSVLPTAAEMVEVFDDHFAIWEPKDVGGGDIYLIRKCEGGTLLFVADCTGHGVPGAFMTMIATGALDQAIIENPHGDPGALLRRTNQLVKTTLGQLENVAGESDDGFECGLCLIDETSGNMTYAGARFELWRIDGGELHVTKGDRCGIGYRRTPLDQGFTNHAVADIADAMFYLFSDGMIDQIGGAKRRAFGKRRLKTNLIDYHPMSMRHQEARLRREFEEYQHKEPRRDDVTLLGFVPRRAD